MAEPGGCRADQQEGQGHGDHQAQQRRNKIAQRAVDHPIKQRLQPARDPGGKNNRDHRRAVIDKGQRDAEEILAHRVWLLCRFKCRHHQRVGQSPTNRHGNERITAKLFPGGIAEHNRQEIEQRVTGSKQHFKTATTLQQPAAGQAQRQKPLQDPRSGHHPQQRRKNAGHHVNKATEQVFLFAVILRHRAIAQPTNLIDRVVDLRHVVTHHHLKLPAAFHYHDHTGIFFQCRGIGTLAIA